VPEKRLRDLRYLQLRREGTTLKLIDFRKITGFSKKSAYDRQIDHLTGLCAGLIADGKVDQKEAEVLLAWLAQADAVSQNPMLIPLLDRVSEFLSDGKLDEDEAQELFELLQKFVGGEYVFGEVQKTSSLPACDPPPKVAFDGSMFCFTGTFAIGKRSALKDLIAKQGGKAASGVTQKLDYLVVGTYSTDAWAHETFGRKIEYALELREKYGKPAIITEEHWLKSAGLI